MSEILTREEWLPMFHRIVVAQTGAEVDTRFALIAHDAALRAEAERLKEESANHLNQFRLSQKSHDECAVLQERTTNLENILAATTNENRALRAEVERLKDDVAVFVAELDRRRVALSAAEARAEKAEAVLKAVCEDWEEEGCAPSCDSMAHDETCCAVSIAIAYKAQKARAEKLAAALRDLFDWRDGIPRYITHNGIPMGMPKRMQRRVIAARALADTGREK